MRRISLIDRAGASRSRGLYTTNAKQRALDTATFRRLRLKRKVRFRGSSSALEVIQV
jgi:hypothetical protein